MVDLQLLRKLSKPISLEAIKGAAAGPDGPPGNNGLGTGVLALKEEVLYFNRDDGPSGVLNNEVIQLKHSTLPW
jgi:hypothetical protein